MDKVMYRINMVSSH